MKPSLPRRKSRMSFGDSDTICAVATPPGRGGIGVIRVSGDLVKDVITALIGKDLKPRYASHAPIYAEDGQQLDDGIALYFPKPNSFTGEDVLEIQGHGSPVVLDMILEAICACGARIARPGEFSERAFLNDRIDLAQAEAIADIIDSGSRESARAALRSLKGEFSRKINAIADEVIASRVFVESSIDFPEEEIDFLAESDIEKRIQKIAEMLDALLLTARHGRLLRDGINVVLAGTPNVGKSSLLNRLAGYDAAIVTEIAGTTRDILKEQIDIDGMPVHILDTAGIRESGDIVEQEGIKRTRQAIEDADLILIMTESDSRNDLLLHEFIDSGKPLQNLILVRNKIDKIGKTPEITNFNGVTEVFISAKSGEGIELLNQTIKDKSGFSENRETDIIARARHINALKSAKDYIENCLSCFAEDRKYELAAEELRSAHNQLCNITGEYSSDELLGEIFSSFCIGK